MTSSNTLPRLSHLSFFSSTLWAESTPLAAVLISKQISAAGVHCPSQFVIRMLALPQWHCALFHWPGNPSIQLSPGFLLSSPSHLGDKEFYSGLELQLSGPRFSVPDFNHSISKSSFKYHARIGLTNWALVYCIPSCLADCVCVLLIGQKLQRCGVREEERKGGQQKERFLRVLLKSTPTSVGHCKLAWNHLAHRQRTQIHLWSSLNLMGY